MIRVGVIDDGFIKDQNIIIKKSIEISANLQVTEIVEHDGEDNTHGKVCAEIINKYYSNALFYSIKILGKRLLGTSAQMVKAIEWCIENNIKIINMSLGTTYYRDFEEIKNVLDRAYAAGVIIIAACHNNNILTYPASYGKVIGVKAKLGLEEEKFLFHLNPLDGIDISGCACHPIKGHKKRTSFCNSYAAPMITAIVCRIIDKEPNLSFEEVKRELINRAENCNQLNGIKEWKQEYSYCAYKEHISIDVPIVYINSVRKDLLKETLIYLEHDFYERGYLACCFCTNSKCADNSVKYLPLGQGKSETSVKQNIEKINRIYQPDILLIGGLAKDELDTFIDQVNIDIFIRIQESKDCHVDNCKRFGEHVYIVKTSDLDRLDDNLIYPIKDKHKLSESIFSILT